jgi:glucose-1-phosphate cytidylyltransferase
MSQQPTKAVILAGGFGTRISEESVFRPKPMVEIGDKPILWHIMKIYSHYGINDFVICLGYKGYVIKEFFHHYMMHNADVTFDLQNNSVTFHHAHSEPWRVALVDTGPNTGSGGRLKRVAPYVADQKRFCFTYGDAVSDLNITDLLRFHDEHGKLATVTSVQPHGRFGSMVTDGNNVTQFEEKPAGDGAWINGGFFVLSPKVIDYVKDDSESWEFGPLQRIVADGQLCARRHSGFWQCMDTVRDKQVLEKLWETSPPWKVW